MPKQIVPGVVVGVGGCRATVIRTTVSGAWYRARFISPHDLREQVTSWLPSAEAVDPPPLAPHVEQAAREFAGMLANPRMVLEEERA